MKCTLAMIRHGESKGNVNPVVYTQQHNFDIGLTDEGREQSRRIGAEILPHLPPRHSDWGWYRSPYQRAIETAEIIGDAVGKPHWRDEILLSEQSFGEAEGNDGLLEFVNKSEDEKRLYKMLGMLYYRPPRGDSLFDLYSRVGLFVEKTNWFASHGVNIVVGHRASLMMLHAYLTYELPTESVLAGCNSNDPQDWKNGEARLYDVWPRRQVVLRNRLQV